MNTASSDDAIVELADQCVQCGLCLPHCPTYAEAGCEAESPRGRIVLAKALALNRLPVLQAAPALDHCLGCRACEAVCPAKVDYGSLLLDARKRLRAAVPASWRQAVSEWLLARPRTLDALLGLLRGLRRAVPGLARSIPFVAKAPRAGLYSAQGSPRGRLLLFEGCVARQMDGAAHAAAIRVLTRLGWEVQLLGSALCCGSLHAHGGDGEQAERLRLRLENAIAETCADQVIACASGCIEALRGASAGRPVSEIMSFLATDSRLSQLPLRAASTPIALHTPCTQRNVLRAEQAAGAVLAHIPGLQLRQDAPPGCCGAAGNLRLHDRSRAARFAAPLLQWLRDSGSQRLLTSNIGCRLHLQLELTGSADPLPVLHPIQVINEHLQ